MTRKRPAVIYGRRSSKKDNDGASEARQGSGYINSLYYPDLEYIEMLFDDGLSGWDGSNIAEGSLGDFLTKLKSGHYPPDLVLDIENNDRLTRLPQLAALDLIRSITDQGVEVRTRSDNMVYTAETLNQNVGHLMVLIMKLNSANQQSSDKSGRGIFNWSYKWNNAKQKIPTKICPEWLETNKDKTAFVVKPTAKVTIEKIFSLSIEQNLGSYAITRFLNNNIQIYPCFSKKEKTWGESYVKKIICNHAVYGRYIPYRKVGKKRIPTDIVLDDYFPVIISKDDFYTSLHFREKRKTSSGGRKGAEFGNLFTKINKCGICGGTMRYKDKGKSPKGGQYLVCSNTLSKKLCTSSSLNYHKFEKEILSYLNELNLHELFETNFSVMIKEFNKKLLSVNQQMQIVEATISDLMDTGFVGKAGDLAKNKIKKLSSEYETLIQTKSVIENDIRKTEVSDVDNQLKDISKLMNEQSNQDNKVAIRSKINAHLQRMIHCIYIYNDRNTLQPSDSYEDLVNSKQVENELKKRFKQSGKSLEEFMASATWKHYLRESQLYYRIEFNNGFTKIVRPFTSQVNMEDDRKMLHFVDKLLKKT